MGKLYGTNPNHPKKGSNITVDPIRSEKNIKKVKRLLKDNARDLLLFTMGIVDNVRQLCRSMVIQGLQRWG